MENKKAQLGLAIINAIFVFIMGMLIINFLMPEVTNFRVNMNCDSYTTISDATKLLCLVSDITIVYWIWLIFSITIGVIISRLNL
jgi:hypothetical protein